MAFPGIVWRLLDGIVLIVVFIVQSVILSLFTVYSKATAELPNNYVNPIYQKLLWLVGDFICLLGFALAWLVGFKHIVKASEINKPDTTQDNVDEDVENEARIAGQPSKYSFLGYLSSEKLPLTYISWFFYATLLTLKITVICSDWMEMYDDKLGDDGESVGLLEPETLLLGIGLSGIIFSLLVEANHNARKDDMKRNDYLNHISYEVALEILDTASLLSFLLPSSETISRARAAGDPLEHYPTFMTAAIITLSAINLLLPCITLYKLTANKYGEIYHVKVELIYNSLHFLLVNLPFVIMRIYLWTIHGHKDILFLIKNMYMIVGYFRGTFSDLLHLKGESENKPTNDDSSTSTSAKNRRGNESASSPNGDQQNSIEVRSLMK